MLSISWKHTTTSAKFIIQSDEIGYTCSNNKHHETDESEHGYEFFSFGYVRECVKVNKQNKSVKKKTIEFEICIC